MATAVNLINPRIDWRNKLAAVAYRKQVDQKRNKSQIKAARENVNRRSAAERSKVSWRSREKQMNVSLINTLNYKINLGHCVSKSSINELTGTKKYNS